MHLSLRVTGRVVAAAVLLLAGMGVASATDQASAASTPNCGPRIAKSTGGYWRCTFDDEFANASLDRSKWVVQLTSNSGYHSGQECFVDTPNNVSVSNGALNLTVRAEAAPFVCSDPFGSYVTQYTSGMVSTWGLFSQAYGRFEVRAKMPAVTVAGLQSALWLWPQDSTKYGGWPASGEIDIAEAYSLYPDRAVPYVHYVPAAPDPNVTNTNCVISGLDQFHRYVAEWTPSSIKIMYDGRTCIVDNWNPAPPLVKPQPFDQPFIVALTQALGFGANAFDPATTPLPATTQVDYVRVWS